jgi:hypothetical protein
MPWLASWLLSTLLLMSCEGCDTPATQAPHTRGPEAARPGEQSVAEAVLAEGLPEGTPELETGVAETSLLPFAGSVDDGDRHASTVMISESGELAAEPRCSGVLVGPQPGPATAWRDELQDLPGGGPPPSRVPDHLRGAGLCLIQPGRSGCHPPGEAHRGSAAHSLVGGHGGPGWGTPRHGRVCSCWAPGHRW